MKTENLHALKIHNLSQEQYDRELEAGRIDKNAMYLTPDNELTEHAEDTNNPHKVTAEQIGALTPSAFSYDPDTGTLRITAYINT